MYPTDRQYTKEHEWVLVADGDTANRGNHRLRPGSTRRHRLRRGPRDNGKQVAKGDVIGTIESVKAVSEIYAPLGGSVVAVNDDAGPGARDDQQRSRMAPAGTARCRWRLQADLEELMDAAAYQEFVDAAG